jgi:biotin carboxyl carrier protein
MGFPPSDPEPIAMNEQSNSITLIVDDAHYETQSTPKFMRHRKYVHRDPLKVLAHIPGLIVEICSNPGDAVKRGDSLVVLEAMKMKNAVLSTGAGKIETVHVKIGQMVTKGQLLITLKKS